MAAIIKSTIIEDLAQAKGCGRDVRERHEWDDGTVSEVYYRCGDKHDAKAVMLARVAVLETDRAARDARDAEQAQQEADHVEWLQENTPAVIAKALQISVAEAAHLKAGVS